MTVERLELAIRRVEFGGIYKEYQSDKELLLEIAKGVLNQWKEDDQ